MITNDRQYRITRAQADRFQKDLDEWEAIHDLPPEVHRAMRDATEGQLRELREQLAAYDRLRHAEGAILELTSLAQLPEALIAARVAAGLTQKQLADRLGVAAQQVQHDEQTRYAHAGFHRLLAIIDALGVPIEARVVLPSPAGAAPRQTGSVERAGR